MTPEGTSARIERVLKAYDLPTERDASLTRAQLAATMALDKKAEGDGVRCVILTEIGACTGVVIESGKLAEMLERGDVGLPPKPAWGFHPQTSSLLRTYGLNRWNRWIAKQSIQEGNPRTSGSWWGLGQRPKKE